MLRQAKRAGYPSASDYLRELVFTHGATQARAQQRARARRRGEPVGVAFARESIERAIVPSYETDLGERLAARTLAEDTNAEQSRDTRSGQYAHAWDTMCRCGHSVGEHTAAVVGGRRDCLVEGCGCVKVRKVKPKPAPAEPPA